MEDAQVIKAQLVVKKALASQGARHKLDTINSLAAHLMGGGLPQTYGERLAQMALQMERLLPKPE